MSTRTIQSNADQWTVLRLQALKAEGKKFATLTAYDFTTARLLDEAGIEVLLVGDSLAMTVLGHSDTLAVTMEEMLHHTRAVSRGVKQALVVADMPFGSYHISLEQTLANALRFMKEGHADAVKLEGASPNTIRAIERLTVMGVPIVGHLGLTPQSLKTMGGFKVQAKTCQAAEQLLHDAQALQAAGAWAIVLECVPWQVAATVTRALAVPTIGIGAGAACDSQVLVIDDLLGRYGTLSPKFVRQYAPVGDVTREAAQRFRADIVSGCFPNPAEHFQLSEPEAKAWQTFEATVIQ
jgi:3-methyl-2-oxobutanoate hydroxymethyltransferase